jgi:hypothetical protein
MDSTLGERPADKFIAYKLPIFRAPEKFMPKATLIALRIFTAGCSLRAIWKMINQFGPDDNRYQKPFKNAVCNCRMM